MTNADFFSVAFPTPGAVKLNEIARRAGLSVYAAYDHLRQLKKSGAITMPKRGYYEPVHDWNPQPVQTAARKPEPAALLPCGHPATSLPFCLRCRQLDRRTYCRNNSKWLPTLRTQMRRA